MGSRWRKGPGAWPGGLPLSWGQTAYEARSLTSILSSFLWRCSSFTRCSIRATRVSASSCCSRSRRAAPRTPSPGWVDAGGVAGVCAGGEGSP